MKPDKSNTASMNRFAVLAFIVVGLPLLQEPPYLPDPAEFDRMNFAFYREAAYEGYLWETADTQLLPPIQD